MTLRTDFNLNSMASVDFLTERLNVRSMRPHAGLHVNATLPKDAWVQLDTVVYDVVRAELVGVMDLMTMGLTHQLSDLGVTVTEWQRLVDMDGAQTDMAAETAGDESALEFQLDGAPVPITHKDFRLNIRTLLASLRSGNGLDTLGANVAARKVRDRLEAMLFNGTGTVTSGTYTIYGYVTHPQTTTGTADSYAGGGAGSGDFSVVGNAHNVIRGMIASMNAKGYFTGDLGVYVARAQFDELNMRYSDGSGQTQLTAILQTLGTANGGRIRFVKASDDLASGSVVMVAMRADVVDMAIVTLEGGEVVPVQWASQGSIGGRGIIEHFKVMAAMVPRIKALRNTAGTLVNGVVVATGA